MSKIIGHGIDMIECRRIEAMAEKYGPRFLERIFTTNEQNYSLPRKRKWEHLAGRFAAKEAVLKAIGTGWRGKIAWTDIDVVNNSAGRPDIVLTGHTKILADQLGIDKILLSISHTDTHAIASAIAVGPN